jgi:signal peptidase I
MASKDNKLRNWLLYGALPLGIVALVVVLRFFVLIPFRANTHTMEPKIRQGAWALALRGKTPHRGDVVLLQVQEVTGDRRHHQLVLGRVIGLPGDSVELLEGKPYINARPLKDYRAQRTQESYALRVPRRGGTYTLSPRSLVVYRTALVREERLGLARDHRERLGTDTSTWIEKLRRDPRRTFYRDYYWVLIDQPSLAPDSRHLGIIPSEAIEGVVLFAL